eukprot:GHVU01100851.1.p2 GENE.GHVU01100851.1~~GHVU01100851.1.p2  ORF type:complete len:117 (+),score=33.71 GHVU01100851.1:644-994(+)
MLDDKQVEKEGDKEWDKEVEKQGKKKGDKERVEEGENKEKEEKKRKRKRKSNKAELEGDNKGHDNIEKKGAHDDEQVAEKLDSKVYKGSRKTTGKRDEVNVVNQTDKHQAQKSCHR